MPAAVSDAAVGVGEKDGGGECWEHTGIDEVPLESQHLAEPSGDARMANPAGLCPTVSPRSGQAYIACWTGIPHSGQAGVTGGWEGCREETCRSSPH